uniref:Secreted protein n=1 Tax=Helianthus annuus TaxID=4232 RepID=A0A251VGY6_HELAN
MFYAFVIRLFICCCGLKVIDGLRTICRLLDLGCFCFFLNDKERCANHCETGCCGQGRLIDCRQPLGSHKYAETRPPPAQRHDSGVIGKTSPQLAPPVFTFHLDVAKNNVESGSRTWVIRNTKSFPNHSTTTSLAQFAFVDWWLQLQEMEHA